MPSRAERRRAERGVADQGVTGDLCCKFCKSTRGTFEKRGNRFACQTAECRGALTTKQLFDKEVGGI